MSKSGADLPIGQLRALVYLEDMGEAKQIETSAPTGGENNNASGTDYQTVWQLEMWKRAEMSKFLVHLKQKELEKIEEITKDWKRKELERDQTFNESLQKVASVESKLRQKSVDLQRREERII